MIEHSLCDFKFKFNSATCSSTQKWNKNIYQCGCKNYCKFKKDYRWNPSTCICENKC